MYSQVSIISTVSIKHTVLKIPIKHTVQSLKKEIVLFNFTTDMYSLLNALFPNFKTIE